MGGWADYEFDARRCPVLHTSWVEERSRVHIMSRADDRRQERWWCLLRRLLRRCDAAAAAAALQRQRCYDDGFDACRPRFTEGSLRPGTSLSEPNYYEVRRWSRRCPVQSLETIYRAETAVRRRKKVSLPAWLIVNWRQSSDCSDLRQWWSR